jgi:hypothetical protein
MLRKALHGAIVLSLTTQAVSAQMPPMGVHLNEDQGKRPRTKAQQDYEKALDRAYQSATKKVPEQNKTDPWGDIRSTPSVAPKNNQQ